MSIRSISCCLAAKKQLFHVRGCQKHQAAVQFATHMTNKKAGFAANALVGKSQLAGSVTYVEWMKLLADSLTS